MIFCRLFELVAEEIAIEDTIYYLDQVLSQDKLELNAYMKVAFKLRCLLCIHERKF